MKVSIITHFTTNFTIEHLLQCQARFVCTSLSENICGDTLLYLSSIDHAKNKTFDQPVCFKDMLFVSNLNPVGSQINIRLRQMTSIDPELQCYFWCSFDGLVPIRPNDSLSDQTK